MDDRPSLFQILFIVVVFASAFALHQANSSRRAAVTSQQNEQINILVNSMTSRAKPEGGEP